ncbi:probable inosine-5'-monophosphate dehydrogenase [Coccomyxa sp. Obi]|nr:probable inosine-5'-monophosphate dehydrogenase [Coccomyxa sp. Obi]
MLPSRLLLVPSQTTSLQPTRHSRHPRLSLVLPRALLANYAVPEVGGPYKVDDVMTKGVLHSARVDTSVDEALELMVKYRISGLPVLDDNDRVVGVVSDYDLLSLDAVSGKMQEAGFFPRADTNWDSFHEVQKLVLKNAGRVVGDVMTENPVVVRLNTDMTSAARMLLDTRVRRLPVVDDDGRLVGIFTRGDVIKAALAVRRAAAGRSG